MALILLAAACSAGKSQNSADAAEDGKVATVDTQVDRATGLDVLDAVSLHDARLGVADLASDRADTGDVRDATALRDIASERNSVEVTGVVADSLNSGQDGVQDASVLPDAGKDVATYVKDAATKDAASEKAGLDATTDLSPPPNSCENPIDIPMDSPYATLVLSTMGETHKFDVPCTQGGPDLVLRFSLTEYSAVYADTFGATWNTALYFSTTCPSSSAGGSPDAGSPGCSDDACNTTQSQAVAILSTQQYYLILTGSNGESGDVTLHFQHAGLGTGLLAGIRPGTGTVAGTTITRTRGPLDTCEGAGPSASYWWVTCPDYLGGALTASTCTGTTFNTVLSLQIPRTGLVACNGDNYISCVQRSLINATVPPGAGLNVLTVEGNTPGDYGDYLLAYTLP